MTSNISTDMTSEINRITGFIHETVDNYGFKGAVIGISGGIDSAVTGKLLTAALGRHRVFGLLLPERDSAKSTLEDSRLVCDFLEIDYRLKPVSPLLRRLGVYRMKPPARLFPRRIQENYARGIWNRQDKPYIDDLKTGGSDSNRRNLAYYRSKHRFRMIQLYFEAEKRGYAVAGTTNLTEVLTGFYVKWGDDSSDIEPIMHLYKSEVFSLARELGIPERIISKKPSPDIAPGITDEFALGMDYERLDRILMKIRGDREGFTEEMLETEAAEDVAKVREILAAVKYRDVRNLSLL